MIDINELRQSAQAATPGPWYVGSGTYEGRNIYSTASVTDGEGFTYQPVVATAEDNEVACWDANARLIAAANPAVISELLDRLEAAESECLEQARLNGMGGEREAALMAKLEAAEKERDSTMRLADSLALALNTSNHERDELRAKIEQMEKQEPICVTTKAQLAAMENGAIRSIVGRDPAFAAIAANENDVPLYALPGAKGE